jgi:hypothetical protein
LGFNRTGKQCRERYQNHLRPEINKNDWSAEEDKIVMKMKEELGSQWAKISTFLVGRSGFKFLQYLVFASKLQFNYIV